MSFAKIKIKLFFRLSLPVFVTLFMAIRASGIDIAFTEAYSYNPSNADDTIKVSVNADTLLKNKNNDTIPAKKNKSNAIDEPISYNAKDSIRFNVEEKKVYLFNEGYIKYKDIELKAGYIELNLNDDIVYARSSKDSSGKETGKPVFSQTNQQFDANEMTYNFKTKKGLIKGIVTKQEESFLHSETTKKMANDVVCVQHGKFTTCDQPHPHFYIALTKAKMIPDDKIVSGPAYIVIDDIPLPLGIPFGFFPNKKGGASGVLIPEYGEELNRGFFLRNGGWYFAINDYIDLAIRGDYYSNESWGASFQTNYRKRYKFGGNFSLTLNENYFGEKGDAGAQHNKLFQINWSHMQDPKAMPNSTFSANVNFSSSSFDRFNAYNNQNNLFTNQKMSNISFSKTFPNSPFSFSLNLRHSQNSMDSTITLGIPELSFNMGRVFPFRKKNKSSDLKWYDNIGISYSSSLQNKLNIKERQLFTDTALMKMQNGVLHSIPVSTSIKLFNNFTLNPSATYTERWYFKSIRRNWDNSRTNRYGTMGEMVTDTVNGFNRVYDYNFSASLNTTLYGMYMFRNFPVEAIRHVMTPSVSFSYRPDFGDEKYGYYKKYNDIRMKSDGTPYDTVETKYSIYDGSIFGTPQYGKAGMVGLSLGNNIEMKVKSKTDTITGTKKVKLFESLNFSTSYNIAADSMHWSPLSITGGTNILQVIDLRFGSTFDPYAYDSLKGRGYTRVNKFQIDKSGDFGRLVNSNISVSVSLHGKRPGESTSKSNERNNDGYAKFHIPWNLSIAYNLRYDKPYVKGITTQTLQVSGDFMLTPKWSVRFRTDYDFIAKKLVNASMDISRDLHCWEMSFNWIPFGPYQSYTFRINVKSSILQDMKYERRRNWSENIGLESTY